MQMLLADAAQWLETQGVGTRGTDLFYGSMLEQPDALVNLYQYLGRAAEPKLGTRVMNLEYPKIQAAVRGNPNDYDGPCQKMQDVITAFTLVLNQTIGDSGVQYKAIELINNGWLKQDANFRHVFVCSFQVVKAYST